MAEENMIKTSDIAPAITIDFTSRLTNSVNMLKKILGVVSPDKVPVGNLIKMYRYVIENDPDQVAEGEIVPLTKVKKELAKSVELTLGKYRLSTSAETIQSSGFDSSVNKTDAKLMGRVRKKIKNSFFNMLLEGTGKTTGTTLQETLANAWAEVEIYFDDEDEEITPIYFVSTRDVAKYLGNAPVGLATSFGFSYIENFLGLGATFIVPTLPQGKVIATAKENIRCAYAPIDGDVGEKFKLIADETGLVGMKHYLGEDNVTVKTLIIATVMFYPELLDGVVIGTVNGGDGNNNAGNDGGNDGDQGN